MDRKQACRRLERRYCQIGEVNVLEVGQGQHMLTVGGRAGLPVEYDFSFGILHSATDTMAGRVIVESRSVTRRFSLGYESNDNNQS